MEILETLLEYVIELLGDIDYGSIISGIIDAIEYLVSLITG